MWSCLGFNRSNHETTFHTVPLGEISKCSKMSFCSTVVECAVLVSISSLEISLTLAEYSGHSVSDFHKNDGPLIQRCCLRKLLIFMPRETSSAGLSVLSPMA